MKIKVSLFDSTTDDLTIVIDLLRASTTIIGALNNFIEEFKKFIAEKSVNAKIKL